MKINKNNTFKYINKNNFKKLIDWSNINITYFTTLFYY